MRKEGIRDQGSGIRDQGEGGREGFTIIELLVASLLLSMLVTILTMIFNQSSIAWNTGTASVRNLNDARASLGTFHDIRDDLLPGLGDANPSAGAADNRSIRYRTVSLWDSGRENALRTTRAYDTVKWGKATSFTVADAAIAGSLGVGGPGQDLNKPTGVIVGVRSLGPDGKPDTEDDISTWPEVID